MSDNKETNATETQKQNAEFNQELEARAKELGIQKDQIEVLQKAVEAGAFIFKPSKLEDLPEDLRNDINNLVKSKTEEGTQKAKDQLYATLEAQKEKINSMSSYIEEQQAKAAEEERKRQEAEEAARKEKMTFEERMAEFQKEQEARMQEIQKQYEDRINALNQDLHVTKLSAAKEKLLAQYGDEVIPEMIPDTSEASNMSLEDLQQKVEMAHNTYKKLAEKFAESQQTATEEPAQTNSPFARAKEKFGNSRERDAHLNGKKAPYDLEKLRTGGTKEEVDAAADYAIHAFLASQGKL